MKRRHLFEWSDLPGWPDSLRHLLTGYLQTFHALVQPFTPVIESIARAMQAVGTDRIVDLCSGAGGPWVLLGPQIARVLGHPVHVLLTDKFPVAREHRAVSDEAHVRYHPEPVDAMAVPETLTGARTLIDGFHHFPPDSARAILQDAVDHGAPIVVLETLQRTPRYLSGAMWIPLVVWALTPRIRPVSLQRLALTYVVPLAPALITWDVAVSTMRCYTPDELLAMTETLEGPRYVWEAGSYRYRATPVTYLIGYPEPDDSQDLA